MQVTTTKRIATSTTYFLVKTQNSVQQANSLNKIKHPTYRKFNLRQKKSSRRKLKHYNYTGQQLRKDKEQLTTKDKHENPMRCSSLSGACFSPNQGLYPTRYDQQTKLNQTKKSKERDAPSIAHNA